MGHRHHFHENGFKNKPEAKQVNDTTMSLENNNNENSKEFAL